MNSATSGFKTQQCNVYGLALSWIGYVVGFAVLAFQRHWVGAALWLVIVPCVRWALFHNFPSVSRFLGYGRIEDKFPSTVKKAPFAVTFYTFFSCPFCPIVLKRLKALQKQMDFTLETIDLTLKPQLLLSKGFRSVPVVEVGNDRLIGNSSTEQLASLIGHAQPAKPLAA
jgi:glutaredoxin